MAVGHKATATPWLKTLPPAWDVGNSEILRITCPDIFKKDIKLAHNYSNPIEITSTQLITSLNICGIIKRQLKGQKQGVTCQK